MDSINQDLLEALSEAGLDSELVSDVMEACLLHGLTVASISNLTPERAAELLFLTTEEVATLIAICKAKSGVAGIRESDSADNASWSSVPSSVPQGSDGGATTETPAPTPPAVPVDTPEQQASMNPSPPSTPSPPETTPVALSPEPLAPIDITISPTDTPILAPPTPIAATPDATISTPAPASPQSSIPRLELSTPILESSTQIVETTIDSFSSKSLALRAVHIHVEGSAHSGSGSACNTPSYLRPTTSTMARMKKEEAAPPPPPVQVTPKRRNLFSRIIGSTLLAPTANFLARMAGSRKQQPQSTPEAPSSGGPRPTTRTQPFTLTTELRPKGQLPMSRDEMDMAEAKEHAFKRNLVPKHVHESRELEFRAASSPKLPSQVYVPFHLASLDLHTKKQADIKAKAEELEKKDEETRCFKARGFDKTLAQGAQTPPKPTPQAVTTATAFISASEQRSKHYTDVLEPVRKAREVEANKDKIVEDAATKALEGAWDKTTDADKDKLAEEIASKSVKDLGLDQFRKTLEFKAAVMPDFSSPFKPSAAKAKGVTQSQEFKFTMDERLGPASLKMRDDSEGMGLGQGCFDGSGYAGAFAANLRSSRNGGFLRASMPASPSAMAAAGVATPARAARLLGAARSQPATPTAAAAANVGSMRRSANYKSSATAAGAAYSSTRAASAAIAAAARLTKTGLGPPAHALTLSSGGESPKQALGRGGSASTLVAAN